MNDFTLIPAIDLIEGKCVRLFQGDYQKKTVYDANPIKVALNWQEQGAKILHLVDLDGAKAGEPKNLETVVNIIKNIKIPIELGGGIRDLATAKKIIDLGVKRVIIGSIAFKNPDLFIEILKNLPKESIVLGLDLKDGKFSTDGWLESFTIDLQQFLENYRAFGLKRVIITDISKDGAMQGPNLELYQSIATITDLEIIASGGVTSFSDIVNLSQIKGIKACIIGKALYEGKINLKSANEHFNSQAQN